MGSEISLKSRYDALDEKAVCELGCKHGFPMDFLNRMGGERLYVRFVFIHWYVFVGSIYNIFALTLLILQLYMHVSSI